MIRMSSESIALIQLSLDTLIKSVVILSAAGLLAASLRKASAASRHLVWSVAMASLLALPVLSVALPSWRIAALPSLATIAVAEDGPAEPAGVRTNEAAVIFESKPEPEAPALSQPRTSDIWEETPATGPVSLRFDGTPKPVPSFWNSFDWKVVLSLAWLAGVFAVLARLTASTARVWLLTRQAHRVTESSWIILARTLATRLRLRRRVRIFRTERISMPMTWGLMRSAVLLPKEADHWSMECRWIVMAHELTHVKRRDCLMQALAQLACAIYWFNPLVWFAAWRLRVERELACDDHVLEAGAKASDYASHLVEIASSFGVSNCSSPVTVGMACSHLESRVRSILDPNARRRGVNGLKVALAAVIAAVLTAPLAMLQPWGNAEASGQTDRASANPVNPSNPSYAAILLQNSKNQDQSGREKARGDEEPQKQIGVGAGSGQGIGQGIGQGAGQGEGQGTGQGAGQGQGQGTGQGAGQGQGRPGELSLEQLIEMRGVGVTPEYIELIRKLGYSDLTVKQAINLRAHGVDEEYIKQARGWMNGNVSIEKLVQLKAIGMSSEFIDSMKQAGYNNLTIEQLIEMKAVGADPEFAESMRRAGYDGLTPKKLTQLKALGVNEAFIREAQGWGFGQLSLEKLVQIKALGIGPQYVDSMKALGFQNLTLEQLIDMKGVGLSQEYIRQMREIGYDNAPLQKLMEMKGVGLTPAYIRQMREMGFDNLPLQKLIEMKGVGVTPEYIRKMREIGLKNVSVNELIELKATGVDKILTREKR
ncbi:MAG TPA: M56 family metallopeptidase [Blastocatellia bacterium]|nr:M56 family metallopeptidase [Blastocatellia bacterium]